MGPIRTQVLNNSCIHIIKLKKALKCVTWSLLPCLKFVLVLENCPVSMMKSEPLPASGQLPPKKRLVSDACEQNPVKLGEGEEFSNRISTILSDDIQNLSQ